MFNFNSLPSDTPAQDAGVVSVPNSVETDNVSTPSTDIVEKQVEQTTLPVVTDNKVPTPVVTSSLVPSALSGLFQDLPSDKAGVESTDTSVDKDKTNSDSSDVELSVAEQAAKALADWENAVKENIPKDLSVLDTYVEPWTKPAPELYDWTQVDLSNLETSKKLVTLHYQSLGYNSAHAAKLVSVLDQNELTNEAIVARDFFDQTQRQEYEAHVHEKTYYEEQRALVDYLKKSELELSKEDFSSFSDFAFKVDKQTGMTEFDKMFNEDYDALMSLAYHLYQQKKNSTTGQK